MTTKVLFICVDSAERDLLLSWAEAGILPNLKSLLKRSHWGDAPALAGLGSGANWPSFATGVNPSRHGRYFTHHIRAGTYEVYKHSFEKGNWNPFWRELSQAGCKVAAINVPKDILCEDMNGLHIVDWGVHDYQFPEPQVWPPKEAKVFADQYDRDTARKFCDESADLNSDCYHIRRRTLSRTCIHYPCPALP